jgi:siderophore synthetase component
MADPNEQAIANLLKCFCREIIPYTLPSGQLSQFIVPYFNIKNSLRVTFYPVELEQLVESEQASILQINFAHTGVSIAAAVGTKSSLTGTHEHLGLCFYTKLTEDWQKTDPITLSNFLNSELSYLFSSHSEPDFLIHVKDSLRVSKLILEHPISDRSRYLRNPLQKSQSTFIQSEQSLIYGHPYHPSPKSRLGFNEEEIRKYSPEFGSNFQLDYFLIRKDFVFEESILAKDCSQITAKDISLAEDLAGDFATIPTHPWQSKYLLGLPVIQDAISSDKLRYLGPKGANWFATSSVRTVFSPAQPYFYKLSLNVRITNCIRRNALHELQGSIAVSKIIAPLKARYLKLYPNFYILDEPAFLTANFSPRDLEPNPVVTDGFGMLLRETFEANVESDSEVLLTGSLFGNQSLGRSKLSNLISGDRRIWFKQYLNLMLPPLFDLYFEEGIMFEPHLQNSLISVKNGFPASFWIRDFDNTRIISGSLAEQQLKTNCEMASKNEFERRLQAKVMSEFTVDSTKSWNRFIYCLLVNHLSEAIYQLSFQQPKLETQLWMILKDFLLEYSSLSGNIELRTAIDNLLRGASLPAKANLITRFTRTTDSKCSYVNIPNPMLASVRSLI